MLIMYMKDQQEENLLMTYQSLFLKILTLILNLMQSKIRKIF